MKVVFINYWDFTSPSGMHIFHLANALAMQRVEVITYGYGKGESVNCQGRPKFRHYGTTEFGPGRLARELLIRGGEYLLHAWTPREATRILTQQLAVKLNAPYVVHMEDNEDAILAAKSAGMSASALADGAAWEPGGRLFGSVHPDRYKEFLAAACGYTSIIESLQDFKPEGLPGHVFWPSCEPEVFSLPPVSSADDKERWGIPPECFVLFYPGNGHLNNIDEVMELYRASAMLRLKGVPLRVIKFGIYEKDVTERMATEFGITDLVVDLTDSIIPAQVPQVIRAADFLVQPGNDNAFNRYRFPCKLPLFMASGRPVILPASNLGHHLEHETNCLLLQTGTAEEIFHHLHFLIQNPQAAQAIGQAGRAFAESRFSWKRSATGLLDFYRTVFKN